MTEKIRIGGVCERDLDLFLQEQLLSSPQFCKWFAGEKLGLGNISGVAETVERGQTDQTGESDIKARFRRDDGRSVMVFVENKIKAGFQNEQFERYKQRAEEALARREIDDYRIVLFAPKKYLDRRSLKGFGSEGCVKVAYDEVLHFFQKSAPDESLSLVHRGRYKTALVSEAIDIARGDSHAISEEFWERYWNEVNSIAGEFNYPYPSGRKAAGGDTIEFTCSALREFAWPVSPQPCHRLAQGNFGKYGRASHGAFYIKIPTYWEHDRFSALERAIGPFLAPHMMIVKAKPSAAIRVAVPQIRKCDWTRDQVPALRTAIYLGKHLYDWFLSNRVQTAWIGLIESDQQNRESS